MSTPLNVCRVNGTTRVGSVGFAPVRGLHGLRTAPGHLVTHRARCRCRSSSAPQHGSGPARSPGIEAASSCTQVPRHPDTNTALRQASDSPAKTLRLGAQVGRSASGAGLAVQPIGPARLSKGPCSPSSRTAERGGTQTSWSAPTPLKLPIRRLGASENRVARTRAASEFRSARQPAARFRGLPQCRGDPGGGLDRVRVMPSAWAVNAGSTRGRASRVTARLRRWCPRARRAETGRASGRNRTGPRWWGWLRFRRSRERSDVAVVAGSYGRYCT